MPSDNNQATIIALIYFIGGIYSILTGIFTMARMNIKIPGLYQLGVFISNLLFGKNKTSEREKELSDPRKATRYGIFWLLIGLVFLAGGVFVLFVK